MLEIGCGCGEVAAELQRLGFTVTGVDSGPEEVEATRAKGIRAIAGQWPDVAAQPADVVVFTRSLHHIRDLPGALKAACRTLQGPRVLLIDDFDFTSADPRTVNWLVDKVREAQAQGLLRESVDAFATRLAQAPNPVLAWQAEQGHDLHAADAILDAVAQHCTITFTEEVPYAYRYLIPVIDDTPPATAWLRKVLGEERVRGKVGNLNLTGRRIAAIAA